MGLNSFGRIPICNPHRIRLTSAWRIPLGFCRILRGGINLPSHTSEDKPRQFFAPAGINPSMIVLNFWCGAKEILGVVEIFTENDVRIGVADILRIGLTW